MTKIAVLIDFTDICDTALEFAEKIALAANAVMVPVHVADTHNSGEKQILQEQLDDLAHGLSPHLRVEPLLGIGEFEAIIPGLLADLQPDLIVVPTHGKHGMKQAIFGANIMRLVRSLGLPVLVVQRGSEWEADAMRHMLFPVGPHTDFELKYRQAAPIMRLLGSKVELYTVVNDPRGLSDAVRQNLASTAAHLSLVGIEFNEVKDMPEAYSVGFSKHIINRARKTGTGIICIMSRIGNEQYYIENTDKERIVLNDDLIPVLCINTAEL